MNKARRKAIDEIIEKLDEIYSTIEELQSEEQESFDNMPESLQGSERGETMEGFIDNLGNAMENISTAKEDLEEIINS